MKWWHVKTIISTPDFGYSEQHMFRFAILLKDKGSVKKATGNANDTKIKNKAVLHKTIVAPAEHQFNKSFSHREVILASATALPSKMRCICHHLLNMLPSKGSSSTDATWFIWGISFESLYWATILVACLVACLCHSFEDRFRLRMLTLRMSCSDLT